MPTHQVAHPRKHKSVVTDRNGQGITLPGIGVGDEQAGRMAADYLLDQGVERPATIYPVSSNPQYELRIDGFRYACHIRNCEAVIIRPTHTDAEQPSEPQTKQILDVVERLLSLVPRPDGLFIPDDSLTIPVYQLLAEHGIKPEQDIRIVSCDTESTISMPCARGRRPLIWRRKRPAVSLLNSFCANPTRQARTGRCRCSSIHN